MLFNTNAIASFVSGLSFSLLGAPALMDTQTPVRAQDGCLSCSPCAVDSCQTNLPGGLILLTQFWDTHPAAGPDDSWTIHGPDYCNGSYPANCDPSRENLYPLDVLKDANETDLISYMNEFWVSDRGSTPDFWSHEWSKHGVCVSTLDPKCYDQDTYTPNQDLVDFFKTTTALHQRYNLYDALAKANILPTTSQTYALSDVKAALRDAFGVDVSLRCNSAYLQEAWIYHHTNGRANDPDSFVAIDGLARDNRCPTTVRYVPK
ncbi:unnamed protein product [Tilletia controversa]|uniref:ribonuclease T2 n=3 Tax=Tilletia TaxID=13289 RepID=A0A8X7SUF9_9BASI|nr:hypothetical protein CF336_g1893 [Tilletia laevis]KAE8199055.1 hypothetical protein CF328_g3359 [Tilletia controversa]KAE8261831.1 hypothetical protein A4X03_0g2939 [Tilletia caries]KAE8203873.1 hypothetical protein CF335_g2863 [Tilletia laevis]KAE8242555.1 hypothetical protein A4X06_0g6853 [Tilletia controversa]